MAGLQFAEIILPLALPGTFTYQLTLDELNQLEVGQRVAVSFGSNKLYTGIIHSFHKNKPELYKTKPIYSILDDKPLVTRQQIDLWEWMADYYMCTLGEVFRNAFPSGLKWESETFIKLNNEDFLSDSNLSADQYLILNSLLKKDLLSVNEISILVERKSVISVLKSLWEMGYIRMDEILKEKYTPKIEQYVKVNPELKLNEKHFNESLNKLKNAPKQRELILQLIVLETQINKPIKISNFIKIYGGSHAILKSLQEKQLIEIYELQTSRIKDVDSETEESNQLTFDQNKALSQIRAHFENQNTVLFHGSLSSGKTEIYIKLIEQVLEEKRTVLFLLPEISVASQMVQRIRKHFGDLVGIYHSGFNQNERVELWERTLRGKYKVLLGPRSALYLPFQDLGLIIVDEEHETAYKQIDSKPYFQARDMALVLANIFKSKVLLGSATPSLESYYNSIENKFGYVSLSKKYGDSELPKIELIDLRNALRQKEITGDVSHKLQDEIQETIDKGKQVIIFQNRRGFAPVMECLSCGHSPFCPNCDVPLTFHKYANQLKCHYCGHTQARPTKCPNCHSLELTTKGIGTQQIEIQLSTIFPKVKIARMDVDAMRRKHAYEKTIEAFEQQEIDILVGTQMVAKGLDFANVGLVGVIRADSLLNFPDFRAHEKAFQLLTQVAGRAGRRNEQGKVFIQTYNPDHQILQNVTTYDYLKTVNEILYERKSFLYPPYLRLIKITFRHAKKEKVEKVSFEFVKLLRPYLDEKHLLGPEEPSVARIRNQFIRNVLIKIPPGNSVRSIKKLIQNKIETLHTVTAFRSVRLDVDVDPY